MEEVKTENNQKKRGRSGLIPGLFLLAFGIIFLLGNFGFITFDIGKLWPIFLL
jgi:hypothetical protein